MTHFCRRLRDLTLLQTSTASLSALWDSRYARSQSAIKPALSSTSPRLHLVQARSVHLYNTLNLCSQVCNHPDDASRTHSLAYQRVGQGSNCSQTASRTCSVAWSGPVSCPHTLHISELPRHCDPQRHVRTSRHQCRHRSLCGSGWRNCICRRGWLPCCHEDCIHAKMESRGRLSFSPAIKSLPYSTRSICTA